jgi:hypothetical protein
MKILYRWMHERLIKLSRWKKASSMGRTIGFISATGEKFMQGAAFKKIR